MAVPVMLKSRAVKKTEVFKVNSPGLYNLKTFDNLGHYVFWISNFILEKSTFKSYGNVITVINFT